MDKIEEWLVNLRNATAAVLEVEGAVRLTVVLGIPTAILAVLRGLWSWWSSLDVAGQWLAGCALFLVLYALSVVFWQVVAARFVAWVKGKLFAIVVIPTLVKGNKVILKINNRRRGDDFRVMLTRLMGGSANASIPLPHTLPWATSNEEFRRIARGGIDHVVLCEISFIPPNQNPVGPAPLMRVKTAGQHPRDMRYYMAPESSGQTFTTDMTCTIDVQTSDKSLQRFTVEMRGWWLTNHSILEAKVELHIDPVPAVLRKVKFMAAEGYQKGTF